MVTLNKLVELCSAESSGDLTRHAVQLGQEMGFEFCTFTAVSERVGKTAELWSAGNMPDTFSEWSTGLGADDPIIRRLRHGSLPVVYDASTYASSTSHREFYDTCSSFGFKTGIATVHHLSRGKHFLFGFDRADPLPMDQRALARLVADVHLIATYAQPIAMRTLIPHKTATIELSQRERDVLAWTVEGKANGVVAQILQISEHTVKCHVRSAMVKLEESTRHRAAAKALSLGLLR